ncbi:hypothetical protein C8D87_11465 [Lentzea atacamensis]|uniref:Uncharacterized protein n=2 Tax=Lentzea atacamensis TaxID=531938 RepID=A0ABX9DVX4_9PSEU|nr:hypothetical protein C8D87_11465 [Lentzea atacamensis]
MQATPVMTSSDELARRSRLAKAIWNTDDLTTLLCDFTGLGLKAELRSRELRPPSELERKDLQLHVGCKNVLVRDGVTQAAIHTAQPPLVLVAFHAVVARHRLPDEVREALEHGPIGLGVALRPYGVRRHTHGIGFVEPVDDVGGRQLLRVHATLSLPGIGPVALVDEIVYASALR